jgi:hypothetical protein
VDESCLTGYVFVRPFPMEAKMMQRLPRLWT